MNKTSKNQKMASKNRITKGRGRARKANTMMNRTTMVTLPKEMGFAAPRTRMTLRFSKTVTFSNATLFTANIYFVPTFLYDVDPTIGSTAVPGFVEYAALYRQYVVIASSIRVRFMNNEAFPQLAFVIPLNGPPGANQSLSTTFTQLAQRVCESAALGALTGNGMCAIEHSWSTSQFGGAHDVRGDPSYFGSTAGGSPTNNWYWNIGVTSGLAGTVAGVLTHIDIEITCEFFELAVATQ